MIISIESEKAFDKIKPFIVFKNLSKIWIEGNIHILIKGIYKKKSTANVIFHVKDPIFSPED